MLRNIALGVGLLVVGCAVEPVDDAGSVDELELAADSADPEGVPAEDSPDRAGAQPAVAGATTSGRQCRKVGGVWVCWPTTDPPR
jgi:hypothetical protein